ncbi:MAG: HD-GYP domain-containing protein [Gammaproteobacteria bacterium]|nr:HD-GYP domain-containing protein [Gammaproteobacteria bacterium]
MKQKIDISELRKGMYVCGLDRPWLESTFLFQGFLVDSDAQLDEMKELCQFVYIDPERAANASKEKPPTEPESNTVSDQTQRPYIRKFEDEIPPAHEVRNEASTYMEQLFRDVRAGKSIEGKQVKKVVAGMVASILRNPDALVLLSSLREHDEYAVAHSINVCTLCLAFGRYMGFSADEMTELGMAGLLHDVGEIRVPADIMRREGLLSKEESLLMQTHTTHGADILRKSRDIPTSAIDVAMSHHERSHGQGYPQGIYEKDIGYYSRIVGMIDVYDSVTTSHGHRRGISSTEALKNMYNWRNTLFDAKLIENFIQCLGIYPIGSVVELGSGEVGIVISVSLEHRLLPKLMLVRDKAKKPYLPPKIINLSQYIAQKPRSDYEISKVLESDAYGIDLKSYLLRELPLEAQVGQAI